MSRVDFDHTIHCYLSIEQAKQIVIEVLRTEKWPLRSDHGHTIEFSHGSQFMTRFIGGWFCNPKFFPAKLTVVLRQGVSEMFVELHFEEALGFGLLDPVFRERYQALFQQCSNAIGFAIIHPSHGVGVYKD